MDGYVNRQFANQAPLMPRGLTAQTMGYLQHSEPDGGLHPFFSGYALGYSATAYALSDGKIVLRVGCQTLLLTDWESADRNVLVPSHCAGVLPYLIALVSAVNTAANPTVDATNSTPA